MAVTVYETAAGVVNLHWQIDKKVLYQAEEKDGRYLLVTNDWSLSHQQMLALHKCQLKPIVLTLPIRIAG